MKRRVIRIDTDVCNGCGQCLPNCPEGALQIIDDKARLVSDLFCDGLGACIGTCPLGAIHAEEREAEPYDELKVMARIVPQGANVIRAHLDHLAAHGEQACLEQAQEFLRERGIPLPRAERANAREIRGCPPAGAGRASELRTWPVQLQLLNPQASFFDNADLLIAADCVPFALASFHEDFVRGKVPIILCPKLDHGGERDVEKLAAILALHPVRSLHVVHMEVPCCSGTTALAREALARAGKEIPLHESIISLQGEPIAKA